MRPQRRQVRRASSSAAPPEKNAVSQYLRVLRNANHGFSGQNDAGRRRDDILLMAHEGNIPDGVALLPYLYWIEMLTDPSQLFRKLPPPS